MTAMKTIEIDQDRLLAYVVKNCPSHFYNAVYGECCLRKVEKETCDLHVFAQDLHCPLDCPRLNSKPYHCDKGRCQRVKDIIKSLKIQG